MEAHETHRLGFEASIVAFLLGWAGFLAIVAVIGVYAFIWPRRRKTRERPFYTPDLQRRVKY